MTRLSGGVPGPYYCPTSSAVYHGGFPLGYIAVGPVFFCTVHLVKKDVGSPSVHSPMSDAVLPFMLLLSCTLDVRSVFRGPPRPQLRILQNLDQYNQSELQTYTHHGKKE